MKSTIIAIVATSVLTALLTVGGMAFFIPRMIKMPKMPDMSKFESMGKMEIPDMNSIMDGKMDEIVAKMTKGMPSGPPAGVMTGPPAGMSSSADAMAKNVKKMQQAVKDMEKWAGKMEDAGDQMEVTRNQMTAIFSPSVMGTVMALIAYSNSHCTPSP